jgi:hypothetical protein
MPAASARQSLQGAAAPPAAASPMSLLVAVNKTARRKGCGRMGWVYGREKPARSTDPTDTIQQRAPAAQSRHTGRHALPGRGAPPPTEQAGPTTTRRHVYVS